MRFAPAREDGLKPWVVIRSEWGRKTYHLVYAESARDAVWRNIGRGRYVTGRALRATPEDVERLS
jgi:hypothetical protein